MKSPATRQPPLLLLLAVSFVLFTGSFIVDQTLRWTNPIDGFLNGLFHVMFTGPAWLVVGLVPGLLIQGLYRWRGWKRFRTVAIISPGLAFLVMGLSGLISSPPAAAGRLQKTGGVELPSTAHDILTKFTGGGRTDYSDVYSFRCSPADTDKLIQVLQLSLVAPENDRRQAWPVPSGWPDPSTLRGRLVYERFREEEKWIYTLITDASREQVYLFVSCM